MTECYIVVEQGYEYNDENYTETDGGDPKVVYFDKAKAEAEVKRLTIDALRPTFDYEMPGFSTDGAEATQEDIDALKALVGEDNVSYQSGWNGESFYIEGITFPDSMSDDEVLRIAKLVMEYNESNEYKPYYVVTTKVVE